MQTFQEIAKTFSYPEMKALKTNSIVAELSLKKVYLPTHALGREATHCFTTDPLLPGILLMDDAGHFVGMISRQRFLEQMSRPYSLELFLERPLSSLYPFIHTHPLILPHTTLIVDAAKQSLQRPTELLYEPLVVEFDSNEYQLLDIHQLLVAQSEIHRLTTQLLNEKTQAHLVQTEKMSSLGRMIAGVSHEIKNPVNCISGNLGFLKKYVDDLTALLQIYQRSPTTDAPTIQQLEEEIDLPFLLEDLPKLVGSMALASERLVDIVSSLRNFSRMDHENKQRVDIHRYIDGTLLILENRIKLGINVIKNYGQLPPIACYPGQISQVFINIISNSVDALLEKASASTNSTFSDDASPNHRSPNTDPNTNPNTDSQDKWEPQIHITTNYQQEGETGWTTIQIWDNGDGIPANVQDKIFDPFFTTKSVDHGTGLGLAISHQIITEKHDGQIRVESGPAIGTLFEIRLPC